MFHARRCELYDDEHKLYAKKMGLGITIYFYGGGSENGLTKPLTGVAGGDCGTDTVCTNVPI